MNISQEQHNFNNRLSIILPTYNESQNIVNMLDAIKNVLPYDLYAEIIIVDDNSPDGTGKIVEEHIKKNKEQKISFKVIHRINKRGLSSAILDGIKTSTGKIIVVMDSDFSHPPEKILDMLHEIQKNNYDVVVGSRYVTGGNSIGWPLSRKIISLIGTLIAEHGLGIKIKDSMSGFFSFKKELIDDIQFDAIGYKLLLEILVKTNSSMVKEIPYTCINRKQGATKFNKSVILDYVKLVKSLYKYKKEKKSS
jgi:dolichol-phosphate mannosyltransferase